MDIKGAKRHERLQRVLRLGVKGTKAGCEWPKA